MLSWPKHRFVQRGLAHVAVGKLMVSVNTLRLAHMRETDLPVTCEVGLFV